MSAADKKEGNLYCKLILWTMDPFCTTKVHEPQTKSNQNRVLKSSSASYACYDSSDQPTDNMFLQKQQICKENDNKERA